MFILKKKIDWSLLTAGLTIPVEFQPIIQQLKGEVVDKTLNQYVFHVLLNPFPMLN